MPREIEIIITPAERLVLEALAHSRDRREADRARAILWSARGGAGAEIAWAFGLTPSWVSQSRTRYRAGGVAALRSWNRPGCAPVKATALREVAKALLREAFAAARTLARLRREIEARAGITVTTKHVEGVLRREGLWPPARRRRGPATPREATGARDACGRGHEGHGGERRSGTLFRSDAARALLIRSSTPRESLVRSSADRALLSPSSAAKASLA